MEVINERNIEDSLQKEITHQNTNEYGNMWDIKLYANDLESAQRQLAFLANVIFLKCELSSSFKDEDGHITCEKVM